MADPLDTLTDEDRALLRPSDGPAFHPPMLATLTDDYFSDPGWLFERKLDGVRTLVVRYGGRTELYSRNRKQVGSSYPELVEALDAHAPPELVADGEVVAFDGAQTSFARLQSRLGLTDPRRARATGVAVHLYLFDLLVLGTHDLRALPLRARKRVLHAALEFEDPIRYSNHRNADGERYLTEACANGWEGLIAKRAHSTYQHGRSGDWLKFKCVADQEFVIGGYTDPSGSRVGFGALLLGYYDRRRDPPELRYAGKVGTGFDTATLRALRRRFDELGRERSPFVDRVPERGPHWVRPELVAQVGFTEWTRDGRLRHPRYQGLRHDKPANQVVREVPS
ncbi:non-homologous end-joining DNA ligase [Pseudonocardia acaciae]|uniref:non-homologous end-joining DNA ligase n=1 Tax=Pseudonocardia acaciae TaxID=551276 RepID=UPI0004904266|nr:non-homologous end-joining DNA ligase [Pseudonocardia acaciae]